MRTLSLFLLSATVCIAAVTPPDQLKVPPGFKVELLREAGPDDGSWICMTQDDQGHLYISTQGAPKGADQKAQGKWGGLWRTKIIMTENPTGNIQPHLVAWEKVNVPVGDAMGMLWAFDSLYVSGIGPQGRGIYRCKSSKGDGNLDTATLFKAIPGGAGEHGAHAIVLGPDRKLYIVNGNSTGILDGLAPDSPYRHWGEDDLLPRLKDPVATFFDKIKAPYGCVYRTDADGTKWELFAGGFRNPYDIAFNADGELFTYDSDMEWDRGLPWYRPTRLLHVVPGGEYGFREGSAKWPAYFPDSLPAVADIGVGCPTGMKFGTDAKGWPEKYRRALFLHDWTYGRILAVTLHEKGASYTARNDLTSYTFPKDAEANGDVEVFLSGKGMPVTDLEFLRDGSMVFTVGGRGTAAALYRVSYAGKGDARIDAGDEISELRAKLDRMKEELEKMGIAPKKEPTSPPLLPAELAAKIERTKALSRESLAQIKATERRIKELLAKAANLAPEAQRNVAGGAASEASATTGSPPAKASAPDGAQEQPVQAQAMNNGKPTLRETRKWVERMGLSMRLPASTHDENLRAAMVEGADTFLSFAVRTGIEAWAALNAWKRAYGAKNDRESLVVMLGLARVGDPTTQVNIFRMVEAFSLSELPDDLKLLKLRVLELSFARQGRPSEERVKALMEELLAHYPAAGGAGGGTRPPGALGQDSPQPKTRTEVASPETRPEVAFHPGAPVDAPAWRLNRELCALLTWLSNPELGALNADLAKADGAAKPGEPAKAPVPAPAKGKTGDFRPYDGAPNGQKGPFSSKNGLFGQNPASPAPSSGAPASSIGAPAPSSGAPAPSIDAPAPSSGFAVKEGGPLLAQAGAAARPAADTLPTEAPPVPPGSRTASLNSGLGPVPNPGADIFPGRKGAAFHAELGRQVIEKTLALMDAAPSQEEQIWYVLCLRWAHGWTPEQRVRYFRWFHEKASRFTGGNSFAKFVEAIRADAASRVPEADRATLADWLHPVAAPAPAAALKPRVFVKAWMLPDLEAALDKLKDRQPDLARGKDLYTQAQCAQCHLFRDAGGAVGPDLTAVAQRFGRHDILESITDPSKVVSEQYAMVTLTVLDGKGGTADVSGLVKEESSATITILTDPLAGRTANLYKNVIVKREKAAVSIMPPGLLYTLTAEEVADLLAFLGAAAK